MTGIHKHRAYPLPGIEASPSKILANQKEREEEEESRSNATVVLVNDEGNKVSFHQFFHILIITSSGC